jgi:hypothetical protein
VVALVVVASVHSSSTSSFFFLPFLAYLPSSPRQRPSWPVPTFTVKSPVVQNIGQEEDRPASTRRKALAVRCSPSPASPSKSPACSFDSARRASTPLARASILAEGKPCANEFCESASLPLTTSLPGRAFNEQYGDQGTGTHAFLPPSVVSLTLSARTVALTCYNTRRRTRSGQRRGS